jgi:hypothetical protein
MIFSYFNVVFQQLNLIKIITNAALDRRSKYLKWLTSGVSLDMILTWSGGRIIHINDLKVDIQFSYPNIT